MSFNLDALAMRLEHYWDVVDTDDILTVVTVLIVMGWVISRRH